MTAPPRGCCARASSTRSARGDRGRARLPRRRMTPRAGGHPARRPAPPRSAARPMPGPGRTGPTPARTARSATATTTRRRIPRPLRQLAARRRLRRDARALSGGPRRRSRPTREIAGDDTRRPSRRSRRESCPREWRDTPRIGTASHPGRSPPSGTRTRSRTCGSRSPTTCRIFELDDLDGGDLRRRAPRALTQDISRYVFDHGARHDGESLAGVRYLSRLGDELENWAIFEPSAPDDATSRPLERV